MVCKILLATFAASMFVVGACARTIPHADSPGFAKTATISPNVIVLSFIPNSLSLGQLMVNGFNSFQVALDRFDLSLPRVVWLAKVDLVSRRAVERLLCHVEIRKELCLVPNW